MENNKMINNGIINDSVSSNENEKKELLTVKNLNMLFKVRGVYKKGLDNVSFSIDKGDFFGVIGESGSGKTTTGKCIIKLYQPSSGTIEFDGKLISNRKLSKQRNKWMRQNIQMIFQDPMSSMDPIHNVMRIVSEPLVINKIVQNEAIDFIKNVNRVNRFFNFRFNVFNRNLYNSFRYQFIDENIKELQSTFDQCKKINFNKCKSLDELIEVVSSTIDEMLDKMQNNLNIVHESLTVQSNFVNNLIDRYNKHDLEDIDLRLDDNNKNLIANKKNLTSTKHYQELENEKENLVEKRNNYSNRFKEKYFLDNGDLKKACLQKIYSDIVTNKQDLQTSTEKIDYLYFLAHTVVKKLHFKLLKVIFSLKCLESDEIQEINEKLNESFTNFESPIFDNVQSLKSSFNEGSIIQKAKINKFTNTLISQFKGIKINNDLLNNDTGEINLGAYKDIELFITNIFKQLNIDFEYSANYLFDTYYKIFNHFLNKSNIREGKYNSKISGYNAIINDLENQMKAEADVFKNIKSEYQSQQAKYNSDYQFDLNKPVELYAYANNQQKYLEKQHQDIVNERNQIVKEAWEEESKNDADRIRLENQINVLFKDYKNLKKEFKNFIFGLLKKQASLDIANEKTFKAKNQKRAYNKSSIKSIKQKLNSIGSIEFEYKTSIKRFNTITRTFNSHDLISYLNYFSVKSLLIKEKVFKALSDVGLKHEHAYRYPHEFSGGQRQRIVIARALITQPKLIIADEPISALDVSIQSQVINIMKKLADEKGVTFMFIAHDLSMVSYACNKLVIMHNGRIVEKGNVDKIFKNPIHPYTKSLFKAIPEISKIHVNLAGFDDTLDYDKEYTPLNKPEFMNVDNSDDHQVFLTKSQYDLFVKNK